MPAFWFVHDFNILREMLLMTVSQNRFKPAKVFTDAVDHGASTSAEGLPSVVSLAFDDAGERCVTAGEDESFALWDARQGK
jgi:COMPASS component SWD2